MLGVVVPSLGLRRDYLLKCLQALGSEDVYIVVTGPQAVKGLVEEWQLKIDEFVEEHIGDPLARTINRAVARIPDSIEYVTWVGDDDILLIDMLLPLLKQMKHDPDGVLVYGDCDYINETGKVLWRNKPGKFAGKFISLLPQRISQPASIIRHSAWKSLDGLKEHFNLAFDYDLFIRLGGLGRFTYVEETLAQYRWHPDALSVKNRKKSVLEASIVRQSSRSPLSKVLLLPIEIFLISSTYMFGYWMKLKLRNQR